MREFTIRLHEDEVKLLPMCLTDDGTYEGVLTNGIIAQIIRASKKNVDEPTPVYSYVYEDDQ